MDDVKFFVSALWDDEAKVFYSESNIVGLHVEAATLEEFEDIVATLAPEICYLNHLSKNKADPKYPPVILMKEPASMPAHAE